LKVNGIASQLLARAFDRVYFFIIDGGLLSKYMSLKRKREKCPCINASTFSHLNVAICYTIKKTKHTLMVHIL